MLKRATEDMMEYKFKWRETTITDHEVALTRDEIIGAEVWYQPTDSQGVVKEENGVLFIEWNDIDEDTALDSKVGQEVMLECKVW